MSTWAPQRRARRALRPQPPVPDAAHAAWGLIDGSDSTVEVDYRACDSRYAEWETLGTEVDKHINSTACAEGTLTLLLGDLPTVTLQPAAAAEGNPLRFTLTLDSPPAVDVVVTVSTAADLGAQHQASTTGAGRDYLPWASYPVTIPAGAPPWKRPCSPSQTPSTSMTRRSG